MGKSRISRSVGCGLRAKRTRVQARWKPWRPAAPGLMWRKRYSLSYITEDVAVAADEDVGLREAEGALELVGVVAGVAADVGEEHALAFDFEEEALIELEVEVEAVAVAPYGACGFELSQPVEDAGSYVAGVPELVAVAEEGEDLRRECAVGVAEYADAGHQNG